LAFGVRIREQLRQSKQSVYADGTAKKLAKEKGSGAIVSPKQRLLNPFSHSSNGAKLGKTFNQTTGQGYSN
jgi:hypothetical protein